MTICDLETKSKVLAELENTNRLIGDIADDYGLSHRMVYNWIKVTRKSRKKRALSKVAKRATQKYSDTLKYAEGSAQATL